MDVVFTPIDSAPSDAEQTVYNVFVDGVFTGYVHKDWMEYWSYYVDGKKHYDYAYDSREVIFAIIVNEYKTLA